MKDKGIAENDSQQPVKYKDYYHILKVIININLASTYSGFFLAYFNTISFDDSIRIFNIKYDRALMQGLLSFFISLGASIGGYLCSFMLSTFSRKQCFLYIAYVSILATLLLQTKSIEIILICRLIQGISMGMTSVLRPAYIKQFVPIEISGSMGALNQLMFVLGLILTFLQTYLLSLFMQPQTYWRIVYITPIVFLVIQVANFKINFPYETPKYLLEQQRRQQTYNLLRIIYKQQYVEQRIQQLDKIIQMTHQKYSVEASSVQIYQIDHSQLAKQEFSQKQEKQGKLVAKDQKKTTSIKKQAKSNRIAVWCAMHLSVLQQLTGIHIVLIYTGQISHSVAPSLQKIFPILIHLLGFFMTLYGIKLIAGYGRKQLMQNGCLAMAAFQFCVSLGFFYKNSYKSNSDDIVTWPNVIIMVSLICFRAVFSLTMGPIMGLYLPEIVEPNMVSMATMVNWLCAALVSFIFPICLQLLGPSPVFGMMGLLILIGYIINNRLMVETKDLPEWQIRRQYDQKQQKKR